MIAGWPLMGVRLVISDAHEGLKQAIGTVLTGTSRPRCRLHFMRNLLATVPQGAREAIAAIVRSVGRDMPVNSDQTTPSVTRSCVPRAR